MGTKEEPGEFDVYHAAERDEPLFVLLARDPDAPGLVEVWASVREARGENPAKVAEARACAEAMRAWRLARRGLAARQDEPCGTCCYCGEPRDIMAHQPGAATGHPWQPCCLVKGAHVDSVLPGGEPTHGCVGWSPMPTTQPKKLDPGFEVPIEEGRECKQTGDEAKDRLRRYAFAVSEDLFDEARKIAPDAGTFLDLLRAAAPKDYDEVVKAVLARRDPFLPQEGETVLAYRGRGGAVFGEVPESWTYFCGAGAFVEPTHE
jgi:hypothetical protein